MKAIIRQGEGKYYVSTVFGYYNDVKSKRNYYGNLEKISIPYFVVWDEAHEKLVKCYSYAQNTEHGDLLVLLIDSDYSGWILDEKTWIGGLDFLPRELADRLIEQGSLPDDILEKCLIADGEYVYEPHKEIKTEKDVTDLQWASGWFHDARIAEERLQDDGKLYVRFDGVWGCEIEVWFWGDLEYDTSSRNPQDRDPYWYGSSIILHDGFVYFVDEDNMTSADIYKIEASYCYFKARHMMYHIIPE